MMNQEEEELLKKSVDQLKGEMETVADMITIARRAERRHAFRMLKDLVQAYHKRILTADTLEAAKEACELCHETLRIIFGEATGRLPLPVDITGTEIVVCQLISQGESSIGIADSLGISERTVSNHRAAIRKKLGLSHRSVSLQEALKAYALYHT